MFAAQQPHPAGGPLTAGDTSGRPEREIFEGDDRGGRGVSRGDEIGGCVEHVSTLSRHMVERKLIRLLFVNHARQEENHRIVGNAICRPQLDQQANQPGIAL